jgi:alkanesulfonate monooxygenase SsuD/methylene tetrahydromethanopterin reductase-like flavin-dependent oxidoreductase (luciferase family)
VRFAFAATPQPGSTTFLAWWFEAEARPIAAAWARRDRAAVAAAMHDGFVDRISILGSAEQCRAQVAEFVAAGVTTPVISPLAVDPRAIEATFAAFAPARSAA